MVHACVCFVCMHMCMCVLCVRTCACVCFVCAHMRMWSDLGLCTPRALQAVFLGADGEVQEIMDETARRIWEEDSLKIRVSYKKQRRKAHTQLRVRLPACLPACLPAPTEGLGRASRAPTGAGAPTWAGACMQGANRGAGACKQGANRGAGAPAGAGACMQGANRGAGACKQGANRGAGAPTGAGACKQGANRGRASRAPTGAMQAGRQQRGWGANRGWGVQAGRQQRGWGVQASAQLLPCAGAPAPAPTGSCGLLCCGLWAGLLSCLPCFAWSQRRRCVRWLLVLFAVFAVVMWVCALAGRSCLLRAPVSEQVQTDTQRPQATGTLGFADMVQFWVVCECSWEVEPASLHAC